MRRIVLVDIGGASASGMIVSSPVDPPYDSPIDDSPTIDNSPTPEASPIHDSLLDDLISWWDFEETGDATVARVDSHGSNDLNANSNLTHVSSGLLGNAVGQSSTGGYCARADADLVGLDLTTGDFTLACWYRSTATTNNTGLMSRYDTVGNNRIYTLIVEGGVPKLGVSTAGTAGTVTTAAWGSTPSADSWHLCVGWRDTANDLIYIQVDNGTPVPTAFDGSNSLHTGTCDFHMLVLNLSLYGSPLNMDSAAAWARKLTTDERTHLYNSGAGLQYSDLIV